MDKQTLIRNLRQSANGADFLNKTQVGKYMGFGSKDAVNNFLRGLEYYKQGKECLYQVNDLAQQIMDRRRV